MGWYIRKAINVGPVRFNLSKSGIGASVGVKGFRIGIRPNGSSYLHAGRYGLYYREELGGNRMSGKNPIYSKYDNYSSSDTEYYNNLGSRDFQTTYKKELVQALTQSYQLFRFDYLTAFIFILLFVYCMLQREYFYFYYEWSYTLINTLTILFLLLGIFIIVYVAKWETHRRRIDLIYNFEGENYEYYKKIIFAFNKIASCKKIMGVISSKYLSDSYLSKINAGATTLTDSTSASAGTGKMPWVNTNISIPSIKACDRTFYFLPDALFVYDSHGVACINYLDVEIIDSITRFIEDFAPSDANIIDYTWQYANKDGGPDRRFNNNRRLPVCLYGVLSLKVNNKELLHIITSKEDAPADFNKSMKYLRMFVKSMNSSQIYKKKQF